MGNKRIKLIMCSINNNNKFYNMTQLDSDTWEAEWGRVDLTSSKMKYPMIKWEKMYKTKLKKGYKDITKYSMTVVTKNKGGSPYKPIAEPKANKLMEQLLKYSYHSIASTYDVSADAVSQEQVDDAQDILNNLTTFGIDRKTEVNNLLLDLYTVIPRKMQRVQDHILIDKYTHDMLKRIINTEQANVDVMKSSVGVIAKTRDKDVSDQTILDLLGITMETIDSEEREVILKLLGPERGRFRSGFRVRNNLTQKRFDDFVGGKTSTTTKLFWHGSRNENWVSIMDGGLVLRPTSAVQTGKMAGCGLYFADKAKKSLGYSSLRGSYWAHGKNSMGYLGLFKVHIGKTLHTNRHSSWMYDLTYDNLRKRGNYDSLFFQGGVDLINNEYVVYSESQTTIAFVIEIG